MANNKEKRPAPAGAESRRPRRPRREGQAPAQGSNAQPKFAPHFVSAPEATPLRPLKKQSAPQHDPLEQVGFFKGRQQKGHASLRCV